MFTRKILTCFLLFISTYFSVIAQSTSVQFQDVNIDLPANIDSFNWENFPENSKYNDGYLGWVRFSNTPSQNIQNEFSSNNYQLLAYYPRQVYLFNFPRQVDLNFLQQRGVVSIIPLSSNQKMSKSLRTQDYPSWAINGNKIAISFDYFENFSTDEVLFEIGKIASLQIQNNYKNSPTIDLLIDSSDINELVSKNFIRWIDVITPPSEKEDYRGRSIHRSANLDTNDPNGRQYSGVGVGVIVRDDGIVGPHIDFEGRIDNSSTNDATGTHGDGVAGILTGAGNLNPQNRGMAAGSDLYVVNYSSSFLDGPTLNRISSGQAQITNSSYGNGCNDGYTSIARRVDEQTNTYPELLHVFSAGNSGNSDCGFGAGSNWGTITGGHKQGKNVIATANTFYNGALASSSSRGPSTDGRIKPDITAHGQGQISTDDDNAYLSFGGTSGAAPGIAGVAAQLYELYADFNGGILPESALIKGIMLNTANDKGNVGPDYRYGWGIVNGLRAGQVIENNHYLSSTITQGANNMHNINIPANTKQVKIMVYWSDVEGATGASPALVNDLDMTVTDPSNTNYLPYLLSSIPNATLLNTSAGNGIDRLNNMEQIVIDNPASGNYTIDITGFDVPIGPQKYFVIYDIITDNITVTYPQGFETIVAGDNNEVIHWDGTGLTGNTLVEYSINNGASWNTVGSVGANTTIIDWNVPNITSGECLVRITNNGISAVSNNNFSIAPRVTGISFQAVCPTTATISWNSLNGATSYDVYKLGNKYMEVVGNTANTTFDVPIADPANDIWVAVAAKGSSTNWESLRTNAVLYNGGGLLNCVLNTDISIPNINNTASSFQPLCGGSSIVSMEVSNGGSNNESNFAVSYQLNSDPVVQETYTATLSPGNTATYNFSTPLVVTQNGTNTLRVWSSIPGDEYLANDEKIITFNAITISTTIDFIEDFESNPAIPNTWLIENPDNATTWENSTLNVGASGNATEALFINNYIYNANGQEDIINTEYFDLNYSGTPQLAFDLAKAQYSQSLSDALRVEISTDCGQNFTQIYFKDGLTLSTLPNYVTSNWQPNSASDWRNEIIDLTPYLGNNVIIKFININNYGNSTYLDNINLVRNETLSTDENNLESAITLYPNPTKDTINININTSIADDYTLSVTNSLGQIIWESKTAKFNSQVSTTIDLSKFQSGLYFVIIKVGDYQVTKKVIKQ